MAVEDLLEVLKDDHDYRVLEGEPYHKE